jgi:hypothetical protein
VDAVTARTLADITADALLATCGWCWARPGIPCSGGGTHLARFQRAHRRGVLSAADMTALLAAVIVSEVPAIVAPTERGSAVAA